MTSLTGRSLEVDFFRGIVLLVIAVDHISGSVVSNFTLHKYAFCDSAEVFVFLGGYASAAAYTALESRRSGSGARRRFFKRSLEIYRAYLVTAALMLVAGALLMWLRIDSPMVEYTEWPVFLERPLELIASIAVLRNQPYLSAVLPMYAFFALAVPLVVPLAARKPVLVLFGSLGVWLFATQLAPILPSAYADGWSFNPFAWQLMFVAGILGRTQPISDEFHASATARWITRIAIGVVLGFAFAKLFIESAPPPGYMKQNLASLRIVSFAAFAWVVARAVHAGWIGSLARSLPGVVTIGTQGLVCFIAGTGVSLALDTALRVMPSGHFAWLAGLGADAIAIGSLMLLARFWRDRKDLRRVAVPNAGPQRPMPAHVTNRRDG
ncbi:MULTISPECIES: OpgC domain-containing protein [unclassified Caballeronia]|uniref:OpgC domain-containing protein n=1 Tax=unclassified Caballeronia TaxID=2646786 RepID=UPI00285A97FD|nr:MULTISPECIES: OpgC domain-containing protein [unclassified Caballeronia]MDR5749877.1 OpgC domain-containing protein [Caballeronia sp. LZ024]MDR5842995.1 OpgC domain-containing protein [Caballeronia sp. LZ031]